MKVRELIKHLSELDQDGEVDPSYLRSVTGPNFDPSPPTHTDFDVMLEDIRSFLRENPGCTVLPADDPNSMLIGFSAFKEVGDGEISKYFSVRLTAFKPSLAKSPSLSTPGGRRDLCLQLMSGS